MRRVLPIIHFSLIVLLLTALAYPAVSDDIKTLTKNAKGGDAEAQVKLGVMYLEGKGVPQNHTEAVKWFRKAAEQGNANAQVLLAGAYAKGDGVQQNQAEAIKWIRKAAEQGNANAQFVLGVAYNNQGQGVPQDYKEAAKWFRMAADQGHTRAQYELGIMNSKGEVVPKERAEATNTKTRGKNMLFIDKVAFSLGFGLLPSAIAYWILHKITKRSYKTYKHFSFVLISVIVSFALGLRAVVLIPDDLRLLVPVVLTVIFYFAYGLYFKNDASYRIDKEVKQDIADK